VAVDCQLVYMYISSLRKVLIGLISVWKKVAKVLWEGIGDVDLVNGMSSIVLSSYEEPSIVSYIT